jgi:hypothetical protein
MQNFDITLENISNWSKLPDDNIDEFTDLGRYRNLDIYLRLIIGQLKSPQEKALNSVHL